MKCLILLFLFVSAYCEIKEEDNVLVVTSDNWNEAVPDDGIVLVLFYAPWCTRYQALAPEFTKAAGKLKADNSAIKLAKVDITVETKLAEKYEIREFPSLKFFQNGTMEYGGGGTESEIIAWLKKKTNPPAANLESAEKIASFVADRDIAVLGFFADKENELAKAYLSAADSFIDIEFGIAAPDVGSAYDVIGDRIIVVKKFDDLRADYNGAATADDIKAFVERESMALVTEFTDEAAHNIFESDIQIHFIMFISKTSESFKATLETFTDVAKGFKEKVLFLYINTDVKENLEVIDFFGLKPEDAPTTRLFKFDGEKKFVPENKDMTKKSFTEFVQNILDGKVKGHLMSAEIPEDWDKEGVKVLVGKNFADVALSPENNVFVKFYAPWCHQCKQLAPIWDKLGDKYKDSADNVIAKMDSTANDVEDIKIQSFPTLKYFAKDGTVVDYSEGRTLEDFIRFVESGGKDMSTGAAKPEETEGDDGGELSPAEETKEEEDSEEKEGSDTHGGEL